MRYFFKLVFHATGIGDMEAGVHFPPFEINPGKSEIIQALNWSVKVFIFKETH